MNIYNKQCSRLVLELRINYRTVDKKGMAFIIKMQINEYNIRLSYNKDYTIKESSGRI
jgi:hypothetical protein